MVSRPGPRIQPPPQQPGESLRAANARIAAANRVIAAEEMRRRQAAMEARQQQPRGTGLPPGGMQMTGMEPPPRPEPPPPRPEPMPPRQELMGPGAMGADMRGPDRPVVDYERNMFPSGRPAAASPSSPLFSRPRPGAAFKKGGAVKATPKAAAPVKKKAGGMIAKPKAAAPAKSKGKPMPAFKKGGAVKGKK